MSEFKFRRLEKWKTGGSRGRIELGIPLPASSGGLVLRWCPNEECKPRRFQLDTAEGAESEPFDSKLQRRTAGEATCTCPYCGCDEGDDSFLAPEDKDAALEKVKWAVQEDVGQWMEGLAKDFNRSVNRGGGNFLNIEMTSSHRPRPEPRPWREDLLRVLECHRCARRYGVYAIAFFCPDCGAANLARHFEREVALIVGQVDVAETLAADGERELAYRILGNAHEDVVTGFETYLKSTFRFVVQTRPGAADLFEKKELRGNPFQNLSRASELFAKLDVDLFGAIDVDRLGQLKKDFEKRHVVGHNLGLVDEKYSDIEADAEIGETVLLLGSEIEEFARTGLTVVETLERGLPELHPGQ